MISPSGTSGNDAVTTPTESRAFAVAVALSNTLLVLVAGLALMFGVYSVVNSKSNLLVRLSPAIIGLAAPLLLLFRKPVRLIAASVVVGAIIGLYTTQLLSSVLVDEERPFQQAIQKAAKETGVRYDGRTLFAEIQAVRKFEARAYPPFYPYHLLAKPLQINGEPIVPLASVSHSLTVCCNEGGQYLTYPTDAHGFPNPTDEAWSYSGPADLAFVGASNAVGEAVPAADNLLSQLRTRYPHIVTLGAGGNGPLLELASIREYLQVFKPKRVLWMFSESHSPEYLETESQYKLLQRYLTEPSFSQGLLEKQPQLDQAIAKYFEDGLQTEAVAESWKTKLKSFLVLQNVRTALFYYVTAGQPPKKHVFDTDLYERALAEGRRMIEQWGGSVTLVYFPDSSRYAGICNYSPALRQVYDRTHESVVTVAGKLGIPLIDLSKAFPDVPASESAQNTPYFYSFPAHYTPVGYRRAGKAILDAMEGQ